MANYQIAVTQNGTKTLLTAGKYCDRNIDVVVNVPSLDTSDATAAPENIDYGKTAYANGKKLTGTLHRKEYTGEIVSTVVGQLAYVVLAQDTFLAEHRNEELLFVRVEFDVEPTKYTVAKNWCTNSANLVQPGGGDEYQHVVRYGANAEYSNTYVQVPVNTNSPQSVGCVQITENGELRCYSNSSSNYAIRPCTYKVVVEW
jgi:hypothetical protein